MVEALKALAVKSAYLDGELCGVGADPGPFKGFVHVQILPRNRRPRSVLSGFFHSSSLVLNVWRKRQSCFNKPREDTRTDWKDVVVEYKVGVMDRSRPLVPEPEISPGLCLQHVCEIFTAGLRARRRRHVLAADDFARYTRDDVGMFVRVNQNREDVTDVGLDLDVEGCGDPGADRAQTISHEAPRLVGKAADRPGEMRIVGDDVVSRTRGELGDRHHRGVMRIDIAAHDRLDRLNEGR